MESDWFLVSFVTASAPNLFPNNVLLVKSARLVKTRPVCQVWWSLVLYNCVVLVTTFAEWSPLVTVSSVIIRAWEPWPGIVTWCQV